MPSSPPSAEPRAIACLRSGRFRGHGAAEEFARVLPDALPAVGGALFRPRHGRYRRYSAEHLHSRSDSIDKVVLPFIVLVEQQMQLVGRPTASLYSRLRLHQSNLSSSGLSSLSRAADRVALLHT